MHTVDEWTQEIVYNLAYTPPESIQTKLMYLLGRVWDSQSKRTATMLDRDILVNMVKAIDMSKPIDSSVIKPIVEKVIAL